MIVCFTLFITTEEHLGQFLEVEFGLVSWGSSVICSTSNGATLSWGGRSLVDSWGRSYRPIAGGIVLHWDGLHGGPADVDLVSQMILIETGGVLQGVCWLGGIRSYVVLLLG